LLQGNEPDRAFDRMRRNVGGAFSASVGWGSD
jgi:hypothetical protein